MTSVHVTYETRRRARPRAVRCHLTGYRLEASPPTRLPPVAQPPTRPRGTDLSRCAAGLQRTEVVMHRTARAVRREVATLCLRCAARESILWLVRDAWLMMRRHNARFYVGLPGRRICPASRVAGFSGELSFPITFMVTAAVRRLPPIMGFVGSGPGLVTLLA